MPTREKQVLLTNILAEVLDCKPTINKKFNWLKNKHMKDDFIDYYEWIQGVFISLNGDIELSNQKKDTNLECDAFFGAPYNFVFEFDEMQHFTTYRLFVLNQYPKELKYGFELNNYIYLCEEHKLKGDNYRKNKMTPEFFFKSGRTAQRAFFDTFRDILPKVHGLNPTIRINEFQVKDIYENNLDSKRHIENLIKRYI